jgi:type I restriction enzyme, S subunit
MEIRKGYIQTEVGNIPSDWEVIRLGDVFNFKNGLNKEKHFFGKGTPIVNYMDVYRHAGIKAKDLHGKVTLSYEEIKNYEVKKGDVFFTRTSETLDEIGISAVVLEDLENTVFSGFVLRARPVNSKLDLYFKKYCFSSMEIRRSITSTSSYTTRALTNGRLLSNVKMALPTMKEQTAIATALSDADALITSLEKLIAKKRNIKQGAMQQLLKPKKGWEVKRLGDIFSITAGGDLDINDYSPLENKNYCYPIYSNALTNKGLYGYCSKYRQIENTITVTARGQIGVANPRDHKYTAIGRVIILNPITQLNINFVSECINNFIAFNSESTGVPQLTAPQISNEQISIPEYDAQNTIAKILLDLDAEIVSLESKIEKYRQIKSGMMQNFLTGKIRLV